MKSFVIAMLIAIWGEAQAQNQPAATGLCRANCYLFFENSEGGDYPFELKEVTIELQDPKLAIRKLTSSCSKLRDELYKNEYHRPGIMLLPHPFQLITYKREQKQYIWTRQIFPNINLDSMCSHN